MSRMGRSPQDFGLDSRRSFFDGRVPWTAIRGIVQPFVHGQCDCKLGSKNMKLARLVSLSVLFAGVLVSAAQGELKVGDPAPNFEVKASDGKTYKLEDFKGKEAVVIAWFPKAFTGGCTKECKSFRASGDKLKGFKVAYFTASCDDVKTNSEFAKSLDLDYPILSDPERKVAEAFGVVDSAQKNPRRWTFYIGPDGKILHIEKMVKTDSHGEDVAAKLAELGIAKK